MLKEIKAYFVIFPGFSYTAPLKKKKKKRIQHGVGTKRARGAYRVVKTLYTSISRR